MSVKYVLKKLFYGLLVMLSVITLLSSIIFLSPVDPVRLTFGQRADVKTIETKRQQLGLNRSLFFQQIGRAHV